MLGDEVCTEVSLGGKGLPDSRLYAECLCPRQGERWMVGFLTCCCTSGRWSCNGRWWAAFVLARHLGASLHEPRLSRSRSLDHRIVCPPFLGWKLQSFLGADLDNSHGQACPELSIDAPPPDYKVLSRPGNAGDVERAGCSGIGPALPPQISPRTVSSEPKSYVGTPSTNNHAS